MDLVMIHDLIDKVEYIFNKHGVSEGFLGPVEGLVILRHVEPTELIATIYEPVVCLILQGRKETIVGNRLVSFSAGESLIVSHHLPVTSKICDASKNKPYIAVVLKIDMSIIRSLYQEVGSEYLDNKGAKSLDVNKTDKNLLETIGRFLSASSDPIEAQVIGPALFKELHFRLLKAPHGKMLREMLLHDSQATYIANAISYIRKNYKKNYSIPNLAKSVSMSSSSFHHHFKRIAETTPLQYQKNLRLLEAERLITTEGYTVASAAFEVGYESANQFSREYARKFGKTAKGSKIKES